MTDIEKAVAEERAKIVAMLRENANRAKDAQSGKQGRASDRMAYVQATLERMVTRIENREY